MRLIKPVIFLRVEKLSDEVPMRYMMRKRVPVPLRIDTGGRSNGLARDS